MGVSMGCYVYPLNEVKAQILRLHSLFSAEPLRTTLRTATMSGCPLISCPESYSLAHKSCYASLEHGNPVPSCIKDHVARLISDYVRRQTEDHSPFRILSVGSGEGTCDMAFLEMLSEILRQRLDKCQFFQRTIEPDKNNLEVFRSKAENLPVSLKNKAGIEFEWCPTTFQDYVGRKKKDDVKFDVVHFFHSLYYVGLEAALKHCYDRELGANGAIICGISREESAVVKYSKAFSPQGLILNPAAYYSSKEVKDVAKKNGWKYVECPGETINCNITTIFDRSSVEGNHLLNFLTHWVNVRVTTSQENLGKILNFWENECIEDIPGIKTVKMVVGMVIIFKEI